MSVARRYGLPGRGAVAADVADAAAVGDDDSPRAAAARALLLLALPFVLLISITIDMDKSCWLIWCKVFKYVTF